MTSILKITMISKGGLVLTFEYNSANPWTNVIGGGGGGGAQIMEWPVHLY